MKILCLDFDGVIHSYTSGWKGARIILDPPVPGSLEFIAKATKHFQIMIYSSRSSQWGGRRAMKKWLYRRYMDIVGKESEKPGDIPQWYWNGILNKTGMDPWNYEVDYGVKRLIKKIHFPRTKPPAFLTIDDRAIQFTGVFPELEELMGFKPWNKKEV